MAEWFFIALAVSLGWHTGKSLIEVLGALCDRALCRILGRRYL